MLFLLTLSGGEASEKFARLYERYHRPLYGLAFSILKDQALAEDALQEAFLRIYKNLDKISETDCSKTRAFMVVIVRRESFRIYSRRKNDNLAELTDLYMDNSADVFAQLERDFSKQELRAAIALLPETDRILLVGKYIHGYSYRELSELLGLSEKSVSVYLVRAKRKVLKILTGREVKQNV